MLDRELDEELRDHLDRHVDQLVARGVPPDEARRTARAALGGIEQRKEEMRDWRGVTRIDALARDLRFGARQLARHPTLTAAAVITLALGIGVNAALFHLFAALTVRSLPVVMRPHDLVEVRLTGEGRAGRHTGRNRQLSLPQYELLAQHSQAFASLLAFGDTRFNLAPQGEVRYVEGLWVSGSFFETLGVRPALGRLIAAADDYPGCRLTGAVISHWLWQREFGGRQDILDQTIPFAGARVPIIGVTPERFFGVEVGRQFGVALPLCAAGFTRRDHWWLAALGRLKPGWTRQQAQAHLQTLMPAVQRATLPDYGTEYAQRYLTMNVELVEAGAGVSPLRSVYTEPLTILMAIAALLLLLAAINLGNLLVARASARSAEFAVRLALGGSRGRVLQQVFVENLLLAAVGAAAAIAVALAGSRVIPPLISTVVDPVHLDLSLDWRVLTFVALVTTVATVVFGVPPARQVLSASVLRGSARTGAGHDHRRLRQWLVGVQVAVTLILVFAALLFVQSFRNLVDSDIGVERDHVVVANAFFPASAFPANARVAAFRELDRRLRGLPGVEGATDAFTTPMGGSFSDRSIKVDGDERGVTWMNQVGAGYFSTLRTPLLSGRDFDARDVPGAPAVAIVNQEFVARFLEGRTIGARFAAASVDGSDDLTYEVIGVVRNQKYLSLREPFPPILYLASSQDANPGLTRRYVIRSSEPPAQLMVAVGAVLLDVHPEITVRFASLERQIEEAILQERLMARLSLTFGAVALALAIVGLYGVVAYTVARRRAEIGIRVALGASRWRIIRMVVDDTGRVLAIGMLTGGIIAVAAARGVESLLYGLRADDPSVMALAIALLAVVGVASAALPARRAASIDPALTLRE
jgi:predicted permease